MLPKQEGYQTSALRAIPVTRFELVKHVPQTCAFAVNAIPAYGDNRIRTYINGFRIRCPAVGRYPYLFLGYSSKKISNTAKSNAAAVYIIPKITPNDITESRRFELLCPCGRKFSKLVQLPDSANSPNLYSGVAILCMRPTL